jgi:hypothetical protein
MITWTSIGLGENISKNIKLSAKEKIIRQEKAGKIAAVAEPKEKKKQIIWII